VLEVVDIKSGAKYAMKTLHVPSAASASLAVVEYRMMVQLGLVQRSDAVPEALRPAAHGAQARVHHDAQV